MTIFLRVENAFFPENKIISITSKSLGNGFDSSSKPQTKGNVVEDFITRQRYQLIKKIEYEIGTNIKLYI